MRRDLLEIVRRESKPLEAIATGESPRLDRMPGIRAVVFDIYGTLIISGSGDVGTLKDAGRDVKTPGAHFRAALEAVGVGGCEDGDAARAVWVGEIESAQNRARERGVPYPEVDIVAVWEATLRELVDRALVGPATANIDLERLAVEYEVRNNPTWPMPGAAALLQAVRDAGIALGIVSNAQFFTLIVLEAQFGEAVEALGFRPEWSCFSFREGHAKPGTRLYEQAAAALAEGGITTGETLYIGNDMLNDVFPAKKLGYRTALFAGDARSLRRRSDDTRVAGIQPDLVITELGQLAGCLGIRDRSA